MKILFALLLMLSIARADDLTVQGGGMLFGIDPGSQPSLRIQAGKAPDAYVTIKPDGAIEYGKDYTPDGAARALWDAVGVERAARNCK